MKQVFETKNGVLYSFTGIKGYGEDRKNAVVDWTFNAYEELDKLLKQADTLQNAINDNDEIDWDMYASEEVERRGRGGRVG